MTTAGTFSAGEMGIASAGAFTVQALFFGVLAVFASTTAIVVKESAEPAALPIKVKPMLDDAPLLKLGGKRVRAKLPDMWVKQAPVKRYEEASAPSPTAAKTPDAIPTAPVAKGDAQAPPPDAQVAKQVDEEVKQIETDAEVAPANVDEEGHADGVKEGTEADPLKARAVSIYRAKIIGWFNARFRPPVGEVPCDELKTLSAGVSASVSPDGTVTGFSVGRASGNGVFDGRVQSAMQAAVGQQVPPPPPLHPEILPPTISLHFTGASAKCE